MPSHLRLRDILSEGSVFRGSVRVIFALINWIYSTFAEFAGNSANNRSQPIRRTRRQRWTDLAGHEIAPKAMIVEYIKQFLYTLRIL